MLHTLVEEPKAVILDIGGGISHYHLLKKREISLWGCTATL